MKKTRKSILIVMAMAVLSVGVFGQANKLQDLVNARAGQAEGDLENRGYVVSHTEDGGDSIFSYWWNQSSKKCVCVKTENGRYAAITDAMAFDCNQKEDRGLSTGAKIGIATGAAAVIGAIALSHKGHHHADSQHYEDANREAEYERGYRDGLYNSAYHNYNDSKDYGQGYGAGVGQRNNNMGHSTGRGGYAPHVNLSDLEGARGSSGESEMQRRGFRNVDGFSSGNTSYTIWWNARTRQCVQVATWDGRYGSITDIETHPKCQ